MARWKSESMPFFPDLVLNMVCIFKYFGERRYFESVEPVLFWG